jgi:hypothetical protein
VARLVKITSTLVGAERSRRWIPDGRQTDMYQRAQIAVGVTLAFTASCTLFERRDPLYCDGDTPCSNPDRPFCDVLGEFSAAGGIGNTCIPTPSSFTCGDSVECTSPEAPICGADQVCRACTAAGGAQECAARDAATPLCVEGRCVQCQGHTDCEQAHLPICDEQQLCVACTPGSVGDGACAARDVAAPYCAADGSCVQCQSNGDCDSGLCDGVAGRCIDAQQIIYVDVAAGVDGNECGQLTSPCATISGSAGGLAKLEAGRDIVLLRPGLYAEAVAISGQSVRLVGPGAELRSSAKPALLISNSSHVIIEQLAVRAIDDDGVRCEKGTCISDVAVRAVRVERSDFLGVNASGCRITISGSTIVGNLGGGISLLSCDFQLENNFVTGNGRSQTPASLVGGVRIQGDSPAGRSLLRFNTIADNAKSTVGVASGIGCEVTVPIELSSNIVWDNSGTAQVDGICTHVYSNIAGGVAGMGNRSDDPGFVSAATGDYHLRPDSPLIDQADPSAAVVIDADGDRRPAGNGFDMGADEVR